MRQYFTPDGIEDIGLSDRELYDMLLTGWVHNLKNMDEDAVYETFQRLFTCEHVYFMRDEDYLAISFAVDMFEYTASEYLKLVHCPDTFKGLIAVVRSIDICAEDVRAKVVTIDPKCEDFQRALQVANRKKTIDEFLLYNS